MGVADPWFSAWSSEDAEDTLALPAATGTGTWTFTTAAAGVKPAPPGTPDGISAGSWTFVGAGFGVRPDLPESEEEDEMAYSVAQYRALRSLEVPRKIALALADDDNPFKADTVAAPSSLTAPADIAATYTESEVQALRNDISNLRTTVSALLTALKNAGVVASE